MVLRRVTVTSTTTLPNGRRIASKDASSFAAALKGAQQLFSASRINTKYRSELTSIAVRLNSAIEAAIVKELGGGQIKAGRGGFYPDFFVQLDEGGVAFREQKLVSTIEEENRVVRKGTVKLAGGEGITLQRGSQELLTGFDTATGSPQEIKEILPTTRFVNSLLENKNDQEALIKIISGKGKAATAVRSSMVTKANTIDIPVQFRGQLQNRSIRFSFADMVKAVRAKKARILVTAYQDGVKLNFSFNGSTITKALNDMNKVIVKELNGSLGREVLKAISEEIVLGPGVAAEIGKFLKDLNLEYALKYIPGSAKIVTGVIKPSGKNAALQRTTQRFISGVQLTALVQRRLGQTMERTGEPSPPDLKERTGRFRKSVTVIPNYRSGTLRFSYNPLYTSLQRYGYNPDQQIVTSIRDVASNLFKKEFRIVRDFNYANQ